MEGNLQVLGFERENKVSLSKVWCRYLCSRQWLCSTHCAKFCTWQWRHLNRLLWKKLFDILTYKVLQVLIYLDIRNAILWFHQLMEAFPIAVVFKRKQMNYERKSIANCWHMNWRTDTGKSVEKDLQRSHLLWSENVSTAPNLHLWWDTS